MTATVHRQAQQAQQVETVIAITLVNAPQIFNYEEMEWELEVEPTSEPYNYPKNQLFHLYMISGHLLIDVWPKDALLAGNDQPSHMCIVAWAAVENTTGTVH